MDGTIEIERLENVLYVNRPSSSQANATLQLFKVVKDGEEAVRVPIKFGRSSATTIEILSGLQAGDELILSDTSAYDEHDRIRLQ